MTLYYKKTTHQILTNVKHILIRISEFVNNVVLVFLFIKIAYL